MADPQQPKFITVERDGKEMNIAPTLFRQAQTKGWVAKGSQSDWDKTGTMDKLTAGFNPGAQGHNPLIRGLDTIGGTALGLIPNIASAFSKPPTPDEKETYRGKIESSDSGNMAKDYLGRVMLGGERLLGKPVVDAAKDYADPKTRPTLKGAMSVLPEALGTGFGNVAATDIMREVGQRVNKIRTGSYGDAVAELEKYRRTTNKVTMGKQQKLIAEKYHAAMRERMNIEWDNLYKHLEDTPADALAITKALEPLAKRDPVIQKWLETNIVESKSGESVTMPLWARVRELSKQLNGDLANPHVDRTIKAEIQPAHSALEKILADAADRQGLSQQYKRAYGLNRKVENIIKHTGLESTKIKPSPLWQLGGAGVGIMASRGLGVSGELGSAFLGGAVGKYAGELATPKNAYKVPDLSRSGESAFWNELGEPKPRGAGGKNLKTGDKVTHYDRGSAHAAKVSKMAKEGKPVSGGSQAADAADPWKNIHIDKAATEMAIKERQNGQLPSGMSVVQRAQQIKEDLLGGPDKGKAK